MPEIGPLDDRREHFPHVGIVERRANAQREDEIRPLQPARHPRLRLTRPPQPKLGPKLTRHIDRREIMPALRWLRFRHEPTRAAHG